MEECDVDEISDQQYEGHEEEAYQSDTLKVLGLTRYREDLICSGARTIIISLVSKIPNEGESG